MLNLEKALSLTIKARQDIAATFELEQMIRDAIVAGINKNKSTYKPYIALKRILRKTIKADPGCINLHGVWYQNGKQYFSNGFYLIELYTPVEGLPQVAPALNPSDFFKEDEYTGFTIVDPNQVKIQLKQARADVKANNLSTVIRSNNGLYKIGDSYFNVELLNDVISVIGSDNLIALTKPGPDKHCILKSQNGRAFVCPVRKGV